MAILAYIGARIGIGLFTMFAVSLIVFLAMHLLPGGFEQIILGPIQTEATRREACLHRVRLGCAAARAVPQMARRSVARRLWRLNDHADSRGAGACPARRATLELAALAILLTLLRRIAARRRFGPRRIHAHGCELWRGCSAPWAPHRTSSSALFSSTSFRFGTWASALSGYTPFFESPIANLRAMALPAFTLQSGIALVLRTTRESVLNAGHERTYHHRSRRGSPAQIIGVISCETPQLPILTVTTMYLAALMGDFQVVIEAPVRRYPGSQHYLETSSTTAIIRSPRALC